MSFTLLRLLFLVCVLPAVATTVTPAHPGNRELPSPAGSDSGEANLVNGPDGTSYLTWCAPGARAGERALRIASLAPGATAWSAPHVIVSTPLLMENWADFPSLVVGTDGQLWAQWFQKPEGAGRGYSGWFARSADGGATWSTPAPLGHEFVSLAPLSGGRVLAVWLESTRIPRDQRQPGDPSMKLNSRLLAADGATLQDWTVDPDVCTCCQTTLSVFPGDRVFVAYRGHTAGEIRDNHYALFDGQTWGAPQVLFNDRWQIPGCPVNGPASEARGDAMAVAWFTAADGVSRVRAKYSADGGQTFSAMVPIDLGRPMGRVDVVMLADASAVITWMETKDGDQGASIYARRLFPSGEVSPAVALAASTQARASGFPRLVHRADDQLLLAWTEEGTPGRVRTQLFPAPTGRVAGRAFAVPFSHSPTGRPAPELCDPSAVTHGEQP